MIESLETELGEKLQLKVIAFRNRFARLFQSRYIENLPLIVQYKKYRETAIDVLQLEVLLRYGYNVVIGKAKNDKIMILGYEKNDFNYSNKENVLTMFQPKQSMNIVPLVPKELLPNKKDFKEITNLDDCKTGNFVILKNKVMNRVSDFEILDHYTIALSEIETSRFSLSIQARVSTFLKGEVGSETVNQIVEDIYNGLPFTKVSNFFDAKEQIITLDNTGVATNGQHLKREYQNRVAELHHMLGIPSLSVEKESGVSDIEATGNQVQTKSNELLYLSARNEPLKRLNKRFGLEIEALYNYQVVSEIEKMAFVSEAILKDE